MITAAVMGSAPPGPCQPNGSAALTILSRPEKTAGGCCMAASNVAAKDGSVIAIFAHTAPFEPLLGKGTGRFDAKFTWIGNMDAVVGVCGVWDHAGITKFDDLFTKETVLEQAAPAPVGR